MIDLPTFAILLALNGLTAAVIALEVRLRSVFAIFWAASAVFFTIPHTIEVLRGDLQYPLDILDRAAVFACVYTLIYLVVRFLLVARRGPGGRRELRTSRVPTLPAWAARPTRESGRFLLALTACWIVGVGIQVAAASQEGSLLDLTWKGRRGTYSELILIASYLVFVGTLACLLALQTRRVVLATVLAGGNVLLFLFHRSRSVMVPLMIGGFLYGLWHIRSRAGKVAWCVGATGLMLVSAFYLQQIRWKGSLRNWLQEDQAVLLAETAERMRNLGGEFNVREVWYYCLQHDEGQPGLMEGRTYVRLLLAPIPRKVVPVKPPALTHVLGQIRHPGVASLSLTPTQFGEAWANFGDAGVLLAGVFAVLAVWIDRGLSRCAPDLVWVLQGCLGGLLIQVPRGSTYNGVLQTVLTGLAVYVLWRAASGRRALGAPRRAFAPTPPTGGPLGRLAGDAP